MQNNNIDVIGFSSLFLDLISKQKEKIIVINDKTFTKKKIKIKNEIL